MPEKEKNRAQNTNRKIISDMEVILLLLQLEKKWKG